MIRDGGKRFRQHCFLFKVLNYRPRFFLAWAMLGLSLAACPEANAAQVTTAAPFYTGADISLETFMQQQNVTFTANGVVQPVDQILYDAGANLFRLRIFVNPQTTYTNTNTGAIQTTAYDVALAQQIKAHNPDAKILLDFHYSDTWADPAHQTKPAVWSGDTTITQLESDVQSYTTSTLTAFKTAGVLPDIVQVGNETTNGILWNTGSSGAAAIGGKLNFTTNPNGTMTTAAIQSWQNYGGLLNAAIAGIRAVQSAGQHIPISLSIDSGDQDGLPQYHFGNLTNPALGNVTDFDVEGVDYYPSTSANKSFALLQSNLTTLANTNYNANPTNPKKIMLLETNYPYSTHSGIGISTWPSTPAGQESEFLAVRNMMFGLPHNEGLGMLYWYPEAVQVNPFNIYNGGATALFDATSSHNALQTITNNDFTVIGPGDFNADGHLTVADVQAMMAALSNLSDYKAAHSFTDTDLMNIGDLNHDHAINNLDIQTLIAALANGQSTGGSSSASLVPEPATGLLFIMGTIVLLFVGHAANRKTSHGTTHCRAT